MMPLLFLIIDFKNAFNWKISKNIYLDVFVAFDFEFIPERVGKHLLELDEFRLLLEKKSYFSYGPIDLAHPELAKYKNK